MELIKIVEAMLFSYQEPLSVELICRAVKETAKDLVEIAENDLANLLWTPTYKGYPSDHLTAFVDRL